ncbi:nuclear transport factor 2 family protein [Litchfieldella xinjiangensis]|uniref:nuclear transport factor 2 family protein n=1 Tax=Litchfieldella xinjiangensis TaxID=1166948 RepID=UPI0005BD9121|nr:nuclear transport factor 2 family protein [Halomonas xinjiangensis]
MENEKRVLIDHYLDAYNAFDIDRMLAVMHDRIEFSYVLNGQRSARALGKEQFRRLAEHSRTLFSSRHFEVLRYRLDDEPAAVDMDFEGVMAFDLPDGPQKGETLALESRMEFDFSDGCICRIIEINRPVAA